MKVGRDVKDFGGKVILQQDTILNTKKINSLIGYNIFSVYIDEVAEKPVVKIANPNGMLDSDYLECYQKTYQKIHDLFYKVGQGGEFEIPLLDAVVENDNIDILCDNKIAVRQIHNMTRDGDYTIHHATNVGILAGLFAKWLRYPRANMRELVMAGILTEIGKTKVPKTILNKKGKLEPDELLAVQRHVDYGYDMLKFTPMKEFPNVLLGVLHHHERIDGTGYPNHLKGRQISDYGKILAFLDIYDAMAANRSYAKRKSPFDIFQIFYGDIQKGKLDQRFGILFMRHLRTSLKDCWVGLSDGQRAKIVLLDPNNVTAQPIVQTPQNKFIDLNKAEDLKVEVLLTAEEI
jgi:HD-GYP domain-containing protein (c-di-GMP phosphodiesterase class II)